MFSISARVLVLLFSSFAILSDVGAQPRQRLDPSLDQDNLPQTGGLLSWQGEAQVIGFRNIKAMFPTRDIVAGANTLPLPYALRDFSNFQYEVEGRPFSIADFQQHNEVAGLLILHGGQILFEQYNFGNTDSTRWVSFSMTKSVVSMLVGAAIKDGFIASVDDKVTDYLPQLKGTSYEDVSIRNVLHMASGVQWNEDYADPESDVASSPNDLMSLFRFLGSKPRAAAAGELFNYNTGETNLVGAILRAAIGNNLSTYLTYKVWQPFGMEADANWLTHGLGNGELGGCCISATLRDFGRLGLFAKNGGVLTDGTQVLTDGWMQESTSPSPANPGYGYLWWLQGDGSYRASGIYGQGIYIHPEQDLIIVTLGAWNTAQGEAYARHRDAFFAGIVSELKSNKK